jgi:hypothetical protein
VALFDGDLPSLSLADTALLRAELGLTRPLDTTRFAVIPDHSHFHYRICSSRFLSRIYHDGREPTIVGARIDGAACAFAVWVVDVANEELAILRLRASSPAELCGLIAAAQDEATTWNCRRIVAWNIDAKLLEGTGKEIIERDDALPAIAFLGGGAITCPYARLLPKYVTQGAYRVRQRGLRVHTSGMR